ncbi:LysR family transcriptional regulator [Pseudomonas fragariae (ex Marin et al. 2024)]|uniref:LysR family transcriptional regulator n=1 Tax=Pseudomonas TaxID=286 RepID=UPI001011D169|nr:LysR family transcriptional regulator [Pseudomonas syringae]MCH5551198.1 LysR family transcriptional regulator [Pseudomonas syringae pv. syringae]MCH5556056.1 LysR family transcriptional regulator [Pseudomonas syringae pv. syringae]MCH5576416.1 LysR family transcriptional regulator [Pseudomonas syringae pv. syringae]MCH5668674.1 LysR family transcriptional regulator [Pseudomonas syringae pv. syringae]RXT88096.1 LysR family transcriptional regulator [Pseudomonas syringae]
MIDLKLMRQYVVVAETLNFRKAAQRLNMSQPPLSVAIRRLEECLGVQLLQRSTRSTQLTAAGVVFLAEARQTLLQAERACEMARRSAAGMLGTIRLGFVDSVVDGLLPALLRRYQAANPNVDIQLQEATPPEQLEGLRNERLDVGILVLPVIDPGTIHIEPLFEDRMVAVLPQDHPLAEQTSIGLAALADQSWILFAPHHGPGMHSHILLACASAGFTPRVVQQPRQMQTTAALVAGGMGVALMPQRYARRQPGRLACREITGPGTPVAYVLALAYRELSPCAQSLREVVMELVQSPAFRLSSAES